MKTKEKLIKQYFKEIDNNPFIPNKPLLGFGPKVMWDKTKYKLKVLFNNYLLNIKI